MSDALETLIKQRIRDYGPISIADYMSLCLAHPEQGYYMRRDPLGAQGDFTTSPEISQIFGELLGLWLSAQWQKQGKPKCALLELGPGRGTLMNDLLRATKKVAGFHEAVSIYLCEISPVLKQKQWATLAGKHERVEWIAEVESLPKMPLFFVANEFFDALPIRQFINNSERMVGIENDQLVFVMPTKGGAQKDPRVKREDDIVETCPDAKPIIAHLASTIAHHGGAGLVIDYGYTGGSRGDTLQALRNHQYHDVLKNPGEADLTAHVDFDLLAHHAQTVGAKTFGAIPQGKFLLQIGASQRLMSLCQHARDDQRNAIMSGFERLIAHDQMGELFKVLAVLPPEADRAEGF